jgi:hypothetical protein
LVLVFGVQVFPFIVRKQLEVCYISTIGRTSKSERDFRKFSISELRGIFETRNSLEENWKYGWDWRFPHVTIIGGTRWLWSANELHELGGQKVCESCYNFICVRVLLM